MILRLQVGGDSRVGCVLGFREGRFVLKRLGLFRGCTPPGVGSLLAPSQPAGTIQATSTMRSCCAHSHEIWARLMLRSRKIVGFN